MMFIVLFAVVAAVIIWQIERGRPPLRALRISFQTPAPGDWAQVLREQGPLLVGVHLLIFTAIMFGMRLPENVLYDVGPFMPISTIDRIYSEWPIDFWIGPVVISLAFLAVFALLTTIAFESLATWRGDILALTGVVIGFTMFIFFESKTVSLHFSVNAVQQYLVTATGNEIQRISVTQGLNVMRVWKNGWFLNASCVALLLSCGVLIANFPGVSRPTPRISHMAVWGGFAIVCCWPATLFFGAIAVWQIKRSGGKLYGLRLAAVEALLVPWLLIVGVIGGVISAIVLALLNLFFSSPAPVMPEEHAVVGPQGAIAPAIPILISIIPTLAISFFVCRALWRAVVGRPMPQRRVLPAPAASGESGRIGVVSLTFAIAGAVLPIALTAGKFYFTSTAPMRDLILLVLLGIVLEIAALGCGIAGRRLPAGKAGMIISIISLGLYVVVPAVAIPFFLSQPQMQAVTSSTSSDETIKAESLTPSQMKHQSAPATQTSSQ
ncbi:MAG TPA: hypothetical protein VFE47_15400 [Tepidisphaeraceae bacterium]|jgi:hypothetical protein|nr:hypothetical protein [Tepidisphaeraceae bacterium]